MPADQLVQCISIKALRAQASTMFDIESVSFAYPIMLGFEHNFSIFSMRQRIVILAYATFLKQRSAATFAVRRRATSYEEKAEKESPKIG